jgi:hypothetical protein
MPAVTGWHPPEGGISLGYRGAAGLQDQWNVMTVIVELFEFVRCLIGRDVAARDRAAVEMALLAGPPQELPAAAD